jgi:hypothetical protein
MQEREIDITRACCELLTALRIFHWRNNSGALSIEGSSRQKSRFLRFGVAGSPDIIGICPKSGKFLGIEVKRQGGRVSPAQQLWHTQCRAAGGIVLVVHSADELLTQLHTEGMVESLRH